MRGPDEMPFDPELSAELEAIDLALAGEPVDPEHAELAELALLLVDQRPQPEPEFVQALDERARGRFVATWAPRARSATAHRQSTGGSPAKAPGSSRSAAGSGRARGRVGANLRRAFTSYGLQLSLVGVALVAVFVVVLVGTRSGGSSSGSFNGAGIASSSASSANARPGITASQPTRTGGASGGEAPAKSGAAGAARLGGIGGPAGAVGRHAGGRELEQTAAGGSSGSAASRAPAGASSGSAASTAPAGASGGAAASTTPASAPVPNTSGRKVVQGAQLTLQAPAARIDTVAQEVYDVVSAQNGIVESSHVTTVAGDGDQGSATFNLSVPTGNLEAALGSLSSLRYARVLARSDSAQDVTGTYHNEQHRLQDAQALRTSLLKQLAAATTQQQIDAIKAQLQGAEQQIAVAQSALKQLQRRVSYSTVLVSLNAGTPPPTATTHGSHGAGGFTISRSAHDALRVLVVAAGVVLIALAAMIPVGLVAALIAWLAAWFRRRRREAALDQG